MKVSNIVFKTTEALIILIMVLSFYVFYNTGDYYTEEFAVRATAVSMVALPATLLVEWSFYGLRITVNKILNIRRSRKE